MVVDGSIRTAPRPVPGAAVHPSPHRALVYCHDLFGLGNVSRMLSFCRRLQERRPALQILFVTGSGALRGFALPARFEYIKLPEIFRTEAGEVRPRTLERPTVDVARLRARLIAEAADAFDPDLVLIDKKPLGALDELAPALGLLARRGRARNVLVLRDILDSPARTRRELADGRFADAVAAHIDRVLVLGERSLFDVAAAYGLSGAVADRLRYCGYLEPAEPPVAAGPQGGALAALGLSPSRPTVLVTVGGGEDGGALVDLALAAAMGPLRAKQMALVCGPKLPTAARMTAQAAQAARPGLRVLPETEAMLSLMRAADAVVSMAGYNTVCEVMASGTPAVLAPRAHPSEEQATRAALLASWGLATVLGPDAGPDCFAAAVRAALAGPRATAPRFFHPKGSAARIDAALADLFPPSPETLACPA